MKRLLFASVLLFAAASTASADYILIKIDLNKFAMRPGAGGAGGAGAIGGFPGGERGGGPGPGGFQGPGGIGGGVPGPGGVGGFPGPGGAGGGGMPMQLFVPPGGVSETPLDPNQPNPLDDPDARWISAVVEIKNKSKMPQVLPNGLGMVFDYEHRWSTRTCWLPVNSPIAPWIDWPITQSDRFSTDFATKLNKEKAAAKSDKGKNIDGLLYLAKAALARGYLTQFHSAMKEIEAVDAKHPIVSNYYRVKKGLASPFKAEDPAQADFLKELGERGYKQTYSPKGHFAIYFDATVGDKFRDALITRRLALMEETLDSFYFWFAIQKDSTIQPSFPKYRLNSVLAVSKDEFNNRHGEWGQLPMVADGFTPRRDNIVVQSAEVRLNDPLFHEFKGLVTSKIVEANQRMEQQGLKITLTREELLSGKTRDNKLAGAAAISIAAAQTAVLLEKALEDGAERHTVTHESVRQILIASEMFPRNVQIPEWTIEGLAAFFETPEGSVYSTFGAPSWKHLVSFKHHLRVTKKIDRANPKNVLFKVVTDGYFNDARNRQREAQEQPGNPSMQYAAQEGWELARSTSWAFVYYLAQKGKMDAIFQYGKELDKLPRDLDLNEQVLQASFGKAFNMADPRNAQLLDDTKLQNVALNWVKTMDETTLDPSKLQAYYERERARNEPPPAAGSDVVVSSPKSGTGKLPPNPGQAPAGWQEYNSPEGGFSVNFPSPPMEDSKDVDTLTGKMKISIVGTENSDKKGGFAVMWAEMPAGPNYTDDAIAVKVFDSIVSSLNKGGKVNSMVKTSLGGANGREILAEDKDGAKQKMRIYLSGSKMYVVIVGWDKEGTMPGDTAKFFSSFRITGAGEGNPNPPSNPPPQPAQGGNLTGAWNGSATLAGNGKLGFQFQPGGTVTMLDRDGATPGNYNKNGNNITLTFGPITYTGTVNGNTMSGTANNGRDNWQWTVSRGAGGFNPMPPNKGPFFPPKKGKGKF